MKRAHDPEKFKMEKTQDVKFNFRKYRLHNDKILFFKNIGNKVQASNFKAFPAILQPSLDELERNASISNLICEKLLCSNFTSNLIPGFTETVTLSKSVIQRVIQECVSRT